MENVDTKQLNRTACNLHRVILIPNLKKNMISIGQLVNNGHTINYEDGVWKMTKEAMMLVREKRGTLYMTTPNTGFTVICCK